MTRLIALALLVALSGCATLSRMAEEEAANTRHGNLDANGRAELLFPGQDLAGVERMDCTHPRQGFGPDRKLPCWGRDTDQGLIVRVLGQSGTRFTVRLHPR